MAKLGVSIFILSVIFTVSCSAQQSEEQALKSLRDITSNGKLPPETFVADLENRYAGKRTGALATLLHARIKYENQDFAGAAQLLNSDIFRNKTHLADHALWLRGKALQSAGDNGEAMAVFGKLLNDHPESIRVRDAKLLWSTSAISAGRAVDVPPFLVQMSEANDGDALLLTAKAYEAQGSQGDAAAYFRRTYFFAAGSAAAKEAEIRLGADTRPQTPEETLAMADYSVKIGKITQATQYFGDYVQGSGVTPNPSVLVRYIAAIALDKRPADAQRILAQIPTSAVKEQEAAYREMILGYAKAKMWPQARSTMDDMRLRFPNGKLVAKTLIDLGLAARDAKNRTDEGYFLDTAVSAYPNAIEVAQAQFESAWFQHMGKNFAVSSQMLTEHLVRYAGKDTTNRGIAGYWAARDSERIGKIAEACALYDGTAYRYGANWYGYLALGRLTSLRAQGNCRSTSPPNETIAKAVANLKIVTVAGETSTEKELDRVEKSDELSIIGLFDWAIDELNTAKKTAGNSPKINLALARHYRWKGDNTAAFLALKSSYPDYAQMFPEEMGREEWAIFYPLLNWNDIKYWSGERRLDPYQVAGMIRTESVFIPTAKSGANAYGLMQLLVPTAQTMAKKYVSKTSMVTPTALYQPPLNIELGTAYFRDQLDKFGRLEYVAVAYNAGPGRVPQWRATLPPEMDDFVEAIPFKETRLYVQGIIRNTAQYRRLYDENGNFRQNVGSRPLRGEIDSKPLDQVLAENPELFVDTTAE